MLLIYWGLHVQWGTRWRCATSRKVTGSIPDDVIGIFHWHNPSGCTIALRLTQLLTEMNNRNISWGVKAAGAYGWQPYHLHMPTVLKSGILNHLEPSGPVQACNGIAFAFVTYVDILGIIWFISFLWINIKMYWFTIIWLCFSLSMVYDGFAFVPWNWFQVHIEFRRQCLEMTVDKLLEQFVLNKYTGLEKPGKFYFSFICILFYITLTCSNQTTIAVWHMMHLCWNVCTVLTFCWPCIMQWFLVIVQLDAQILFNVFIYL